MNPGSKLLWMQGCIRSASSVLFDTRLTEMTGTIAAHIRSRQKVIVWSLRITSKKYDILIHQRDRRWLILLLRIEVFGSFFTHSSSLNIGSWHVAIFATILKPNFDNCPKQLGTNPKDCYHSTQAERESSFDISLSEP